MNGYQKSIQILKEREKKKRQGAKYGEERRMEGFYIQTIYHWRLEEEIKDLRLTKEVLSVLDFV